MPTCMNTLAVSLRSWCRITAVLPWITTRGWKDQRINAVYQEMAEHYGTAIIPARVRAPRDKANVEGSVGNISTWITAALRNEQFFSLSELNAGNPSEDGSFQSPSLPKERGQPV